MSIADRRTVEKQYATSASLETRISIHDKYSRNKQPFGEWVISHYDLQPGEYILELGCGTGTMWQGITLPVDCRLLLTDLSEGMLDTARRNTAHLHAEYAVCDAMCLPYANASFDVVIANMMLYHVPDIETAVREIRRVLKPEGRFFAATFGENGITQAVLSMLGLPCTVNHRFTLQNGKKLLTPYFKDVQLYHRPDALDVTNLNDLILYLRSLAGMSLLAETSDDMLLSVLSAHMVDGVLTLPKEYGLFVCKGINP